MLLLRWFAALWLQLVLEDLLAIVVRRAIVAVLCS